MDAAQQIELSPLPKTWLVDVDGTVFRHNGHLNGPDELLPGVLDFINGLPAADTVVLMTARAATHEEATVAALRRHGVRFDRILFGLPTGERVLINDAKPSGLATAHAVNVPRDAGLARLCSTFLIVDK
jgi:hypothetical protein